MGHAPHHHLRLLSGCQEAEFHAYVRRPPPSACEATRRPAHPSRVALCRYLVIVAVTVLLDIIKICAMPGMDSMTPGQLFGATLYLLIFFCKFGIVAAIYLYQQKEDQHPTAFAFSQMTDTNTRCVLCDPCWPFARAARPSASEQSRSPALPLRGEDEIAE